MQDLGTKIFSDVLKFFLELDDVVFQKYLIENTLSTKERITTIDDLQIIIYSNDHDPPHFHVKTKSRKIDAKFTIENCELISGAIGAKDLKKIRAFQNSVKGRMALELIWRKKKTIKRVI
jgi:hypothetical protein